MTTEEPICDGTQDLDEILPQSLPGCDKQGVSRSAGEVLRRHSEKWGTEHAKRTNELESDLAGCAAEAAPDERLTLSLAAHQATLGEVLGRAQLQLAQRIEVAVDDPQLGLKYAKLLREVTGVHNATTRRVEELLAAAGTLRAQRRLTDAHSTPGLRRVA